MGDKAAGFWENEMPGLVEGVYGPGSVSCDNVKVVLVDAVLNGLNAGKP